MIATLKPDRLIQTAQVAANARLCREHYRLTLRLPTLPACEPGQFVHLGPGASAESGDATSSRREAALKATSLSGGPLLRRAFSIARCERDADCVCIDVIYRVVGKATQWMKTLRAPDEVSVLGPLGNVFPIHADKPIAWLVAGGVGLPPMLWLAQALREAEKQATAFCGAQSDDLLALTLDNETPPSKSATTATLSAAEFTGCGVPVVISTDDGSLGFKGHGGAALAQYHDATADAPSDIVAYCCGPEVMMANVARYCRERDIECYACMERNMACGLGTCQSCVVPVHELGSDMTWHYELCCTQGPVFDASVIVW